MRVLLVDDARDLADATQTRLRQNGIACDVAETVAEAGDHLSVQRYDAVILDINLPDGSGTALLRAMRREGRSEPVIMLTAQFSVDATTGLITLATAPPAGATVTAGFLFDTPARFDTDFLDIDHTGFEAGEIPKIPILEILP